MYFVSFLLLLLPFFAYFFFCCCCLEYRKTIILSLLLGPHILKAEKGRSNKSNNFTSIEILEQVLKGLWNTMSCKNMNLPYSIHTYVRNEFLTTNRSCTTEYFWKNSCRRCTLYQTYPYRLTFLINIAIG